MNFDSKLLSGLTVLIAVVEAGTIEIMGGNQSEVPRKDLQRQPFAGSGTHQAHQSGLQDFARDLAVRIAVSFSIWGHGR
jgi:hypothetical protein